LKSSKKIKRNDRKKLEEKGKVEDRPTFKYGWESSGTSGYDLISFQGVTYMIAK